MRNKLQFSEIVQQTDKNSSCSTRQHSYSTPTETSNVCTFRMSSCLSILIKTLNSDAVHLTILMTNYPTYNYVGCEIKNLTIKTYFKHIFDLV